jgi:hypothetical protein
VLRQELLVMDSRLTFERLPEQRTPPSASQ